MNRIHAGFAAAALAGALALSSAAMAVTITNTGETAQEITIRIGDMVETVILQPQESRDDLCAAPTGCIMSHASGDEFPLKGNEEVDLTETGLSIPE